MSLRPELGARRWLMVCAAAASAATASLAQTEGSDPGASPWRLVLEQQLKDEKTCQIEEVLMFDETKRDNQTILEGKISCVDGRMFDFRREHDHQKFELDLCEPYVC